MDEQANGSKTTWRGPVLVALFGGLGGLTAWVWSITVGIPLRFGTVGSIVVNVFLGVVAGFVGTYSVKLDSSRVLLHSLALALLCGFGWKPTLEAGRELAITRLHDSQVAETKDDVLQALADLEKASPERAPQLIAQLEVASKQLLEATDKVRNRQLRRDVEEVLSDTVQSLHDAAEKAPEASAEALGTLGAAALQENRPDLTGAASRSLLEMAAKQGFEVGTSSEVSNSLLRLSAAARAQSQEDQATQLRQQSLEVVQQAEVTARRLNRPEALRELRQRAIVQREQQPPGG